MTDEIVKKTDLEVKKPDLETKKPDEENFTSRKVVYYILGFLEILLAFRLVFKLLGANPNSGFVSLIYSTSQVFLILFTAIFRSPAAQGIETKAVLEPSTIIAMVVYALIAWGIVKLIIILRKSAEKPS